MSIKKLLAVGFMGIALSACAITEETLGINLNPFQGHVVNMDVALPSEKVMVMDNISNEGIVDENGNRKDKVKVRVIFDNQSAVMERCRTFVPWGSQNSEPMACAFFQKSPEVPLNSKERELLGEGVDCVVITPPNQDIYDHEVQHCTEGAYHMNSTAVNILLLLLLL